MKLSVIVTALALGGLAASAAQAMPAPAVDRGAPSSVVNIDYACGRGWHVTPWGHCRPNERYAPPPPRYWGHRPPEWARDEYRPREYRPYYDGWRRPPPPRW